jgi:hypothetical protein
MWLVFVSSLLSALLSKPQKMVHGKVTIPTILEWSNEWFKSVLKREQTNPPFDHLCVVDQNLEFVRVFYNFSPFALGEAR